MRLKTDKIAPLWGVAGLCGLLFSGCGPKEEVVVTPTDTVVVNNPTPEPGKIVVESKPPEVIIKNDKPAPEKTEKTAGDKKSDKLSLEKAPDKMSEAPVRTENKTTISTKTVTAKKVTPAGKKDGTLPEPAVGAKKLMAIPKEATRLIVEDIKVGSGKRAEPGTTVSVHYTGTLTDGTKFDSSLDRGEPFPVLLGAGQVIPGWDNGLVGMKVGGKRRLIIPPDMGYGVQGSPPTIPSNATLVFIVELMDVK